MISIFLGGTCGNADWRMPFIAELVAAGVPPDTIFNPVVPDWTPACQAREDAAKAAARFNLFYITDPKQDGNHFSVYSLVEAIMSLYEATDRTVIVFDMASFSGHIAKALQKTQKDLRVRFPQANIFVSLADDKVFFNAKDFFIAQLVPVAKKHA